MNIRTNLRRAAIAAVAAASAVALAACASSGAATNGADAGAEENPYHLITPGQIRVASLGDAKPYTFTDENGEFFILQETEYVSDPVDGVIAA